MVFSPTISRSAQLDDLTTQGDLSNDGAFTLSAGNGGTDMRQRPVGRSRLYGGPSSVAISDSASSMAPRGV